MYISFYEKINSYALQLMKFLLEQTDYTTMQMTVIPGRSIKILCRDCHSQVLFGG